jgi:DNA polymerase-3 subunit delta
VVLIFGRTPAWSPNGPAGWLAKASEGDSDPFNLVKIDASNSARIRPGLIDEVLTVPLFGGRRIVWVKDASGKNLVPPVDPVLKLDDWQTLGCPGSRRHQEKAQVSAS